MILSKKEVYTMMISSTFCHVRGQTSILEARITILNNTACTERYVPVHQQTGTRTAYYIYILAMSLRFLRLCRLGRRER